MNDIHPYRIKSAFATTSLPYRIKADLTPDYRGMFGRGVLRAIPDTMIRASTMRLLLGAAEVWRDERRGVWVARCYDARSSRHVRRVFMLPVEKHKQ